MRISDFDYELPEELIAQEPVTPRDSSRMLVVNRSAPSKPGKTQSSLTSLPSFNRMTLSFLITPESSRPD